MIKRKINGIFGFWMIKIKKKKLRMTAAIFIFEVLTVMTLTYIKENQLSLNVFCVEPFYFQGEKGLKPKRF